MDADQDETETEEPDRFRGALFHYELVPHPEGSYAVITAMGDLAKIVARHKREWDAVVDVETRNAEVLAPYAYLRKAFSMMIDYEAPEGMNAEGVAMCIRRYGMAILASRYGIIYPDGLQNPKPPKGAPRIGDI